MSGIELPGQLKNNEAKEKLIHHGGKLLMITYTFCSSNLVCLCICLCLCRCISREETMRPKLIYHGGKLLIIRRGHTQVAGCHYNVATHNMIEDTHFCSLFHLLFDKVLFKISFKP